MITVEIDVEAVENVLESMNVKVSSTKDLERILQRVSVELLEEAVFDCLALQVGNIVEDRELGIDTEPWT